MERNCPSCNKALVYKTKLTHYYADRKNAMCKKCAADKRGRLENAAIQRTVKALRKAKNKGAFITK